MTNVNLMHGDCLERMNEIPDGSVDMILADLPYGTTQCKWDVVIPFEPLWKHYWRVIKANGAVVLFGSEPFSSHLRMSQIKKYKYDWVWDKVKSSGFTLAKTRPLKQHENISVFWQTKANYIAQVTQRKNVRKYNRKGKVYGNAEHLQTDDKQNRFLTVYQPKSIITISNADQRNRHHPTQKPVPLLEYLIRTYTNEGETVLDNVMGSGSTGVACLNTQRKFIGIEKDATYFEIAKKRIGYSSDPTGFYTTTSAIVGTRIA